MAAVSMVLHEFEFSRLPLFIEQGLERAVEVEKHISTLPGNGSAPSWTRAPPVRLGRIRHPQKSQR
jgi:hypothetical protein